MPMASPNIPRFLTRNAETNSERTPPTIEEIDKIRDSFVAFKNEDEVIQIAAGIDDNDSNIQRVLSPGLELFWRNISPRRSL